MVDIRSSIFLVEKWAGSTSLHKAIKSSVRRPDLYQMTYQMHDGLR